jgi:glucose-6-phosphate isomerase
MYSESFINSDELKAYQLMAVEKLKSLKSKTGKGNDFLGWLDLPNRISQEELNKINDVASQMQKYDSVVVIGIGGSYLGAKAIIDLFKPYFQTSKTEVLFAGQNLDEVYVQELLAYLKERNFGIVVISKSGTTLEPAVAFRLLLAQLVEQFGESEISNRVVAITDAEKGALRAVVDNYKLESFVVPDDVGGRYSVLTPVGLLPIAIAGVDIKQLVKGAQAASDEFQVEDENNWAVNYAAIRNVLYNKGFTNELMVYSMPKWNAFAEWWKQLFGESEGKEHKGIFPVSINITTDLHSLGQYVQDGKRNIFETFIRFTKSQANVNVTANEANYDKLNYLDGKSMHFINSKAEEGTMEAHYDGGVPVLQIELEELNELTVGQLIYFYEIACGISGYLLGVNPFDQPGVEAYKKNMFKLLGRP